VAPAAGLTLERALAEAADAGVLSGAVVRPVVRAALAFVQNPSLAAGAVSVSAAGLAHEVLHAMYLTRLTWTVVILLGLGLFGSGAGVLTYGALAGGQEPAKDQAKADPPAKPQANPPRLYLGTYTVGAPTGPASAAEVRQLLRQPAGLEKPLDGVTLREALDLLSQ